MWFSRSILVGVSVNVEKDSGILVDVDHQMVAWLVPHVAWVLNTFRAARQSCFKGKLVRLFEVLYRPHDIGQHMSEDRVELKMWLERVTAQTTASSTPRHSRGQETQNAAAKEHES